MADPKAPCSCFRCAMVRGASASDREASAVSTFRRWVERPLPAADDFCVNPDLSIAFMTSTSPVKYKRYRRPTAAAFSRRGFRRVTPASASPPQTAPTHSDSPPGLHEIYEGVGSLL